MKHISITSHKGGVGTTVIATSLACYLVHKDHNVVLIDPSGDCARAMAGWERPNFTVVPSIAEADSTADYIISDGINIGGKEVIVVTNDYLCLSRTVTATDGRNRDGITYVVHEMPERALRVTDCEAVLGKGAIVVPDDSAIARVVDAGLLGERARSIQSLVDMATALIRETATV